MSYPLQSGYGYCHHDPVNATDRTGLFGEIEKRGSKWTGEVHTGTDSTDSNGKGGSGGK